MYFLLTCKDAIKSCRHLLVTLCAKYDKLAAFVIQVPQMLETLKEAPFRQRVPAEFIFWMLILAPSAKAEQQAMMQEAGKSTT